MPGEDCERGWAQHSAPTGQPPKSALLTVPGSSPGRSGCLEQAATLYAQGEAGGATCQKQAQTVDRNTSRRKIKPASLRKAQQTVRSLGKRTLPTGTLGQGHCTAQPLSSSPEATCPQDQQ